jgi:hypothetical protein
MCGGVLWAMARIAPTRPATPRSKKHVFAFDILFLIA